MEDCVFCKIRDGIIPKDFTYQDKDVMVFPDLHPLKQTHLLIVPKVHIEEFQASDHEIQLKLLDVVKKLIKEKELTDKGYRITINGGGHQVINHLHIHLIGPMGVSLAK